MFSFTFIIFQRFSIPISLPISTLRPISSYSRIKLQTNHQNQIFQRSFAISTESVTNSSRTKHLREFIRRVHPDLYSKEEDQSIPKTNQESLKLLHSYVGSIEDSLNTNNLNPLQQFPRKFTFKFFLATKYLTNIPKAATELINQPKFRS